MGYRSCMRKEELDKGSNSGEMEAGLQIDAGAVLLGMAETEVPEG